MEKAGAANTALIWETYNPEYDFISTTFPTTEEIRQKLEPFCATHRITLESDRFIVSNIVLDYYMMRIDEISFKYNDVRYIYDLNEALFLYVGKQVTYCILKDSPVDVLRITLAEELVNECNSVMITKWRNFETIEKFYRKVMCRMNGRMERTDAL